MSLKSVEMQVALPRTKDAGMLQGQLLQKPVQDQELLSQEMVRRKEEQQKKSEKTDAGNEVRNRKEDSGGQRQEYRQGQKKQRQPDSKNGEPSAHPYLGRHIDLSL